MFFPLVALGVLGLGAWAYFTRDNAPAGTAELAVKVANVGPHGEFVFKPEFAGGLVQSLASQTFSVPDASQPAMVTIAPQPQGIAVTPALSALGWATQMNTTMSILAPLYLATSTSTPVQRFLRAVPPGSETEFAGPNGMYAVLLYAGTLAKNLTPPGIPAPGLFPSPTAPPQVVASELPPELRSATLDLLANGVDPIKMDALAAEIDKDGFHDTATLLRKRAAELRARSPLPLLNAPNPLSAPQAGPLAAPQNVFPQFPQAATPPAPGSLAALLNALPPMAPPQVAPQGTQTVPGMDALLQGLLGRPAAAPPVMPGTTVSASLKFVTAPNGLKVRTGPGVTFPEAGQMIPFGTRVQVVSDTPSGWTLLVSPAGFVCSTCAEAPGGPWLSSTPPALAAVSGSRPSKRARTTTGAIVSATPPGVVARVLAPSGLRLRSAPKTSSKQVAHLPRGSVVTVLQSLANGWTRVQPATGCEGFVCSTCVTPTSGCDCG